MNSKLSLSSLTPTSRHWDCLTASMDKPGDDRAELIIWLLERGFEIEHIRAVDV